MEHPGDEEYNPYYWGKQEDEITQKLKKRRGEPLMEYNEEEKKLYRYRFQDLIISCLEL
jgi:hypothetical protein